MNSGLINLIDLDGMLHTVAHVQFSAGNKDNPEQVKEHIRNFYATIRKNADCEKSISFYQKVGHENFRNDILPDYKGDRKVQEAVKLWKPVIIEAFSELDAIGLSHIESDDAIAVLAPKLRGNVVITSSDKDMKQVVGNHYNPFKRKVKSDDPSRWFNINKFEANRFLWEQTLSGDGGDMPLALCGIAGIGPGKASKLCDNEDSFAEIIQREYTKKYGEVEGFKRAALTYQMVRLLNGTSADSYINNNAREEVRWVLSNYEKYIKTVADDVGALFGITPTKEEDLFK